MSKAPVPGSYEAAYAPCDKGKFTVSACYEVAYSPRDKGKFAALACFKWPTLYVIKGSLLCWHVVMWPTLSDKGKFILSVCCDVAYSPCDKRTFAVMRPDVPWASTPTSREPQVKAIHQGGPGYITAEHGKVGPINFQTSCQLLVSINYAPYHMYDLSSDACTDRLMNYSYRIIRFVH